MEGTQLGVRSIAFSQLREPDGMLDWNTAEKFLPGIVRKLHTVEWPAEILFNVNFPAGGPAAIKGTHACRQGRRDTAIEILNVKDPKGRDYLWVGDYSSDETSEPDTDLAAIFDEMISVTPLHLDLTHYDTLRRLEEIFA